MRLLVQPEERAPLRRIRRDGDFAQQRNDQKQQAVLVRLRLRFERIQHGRDEVRLLRNREPREAQFDVDYREVLENELSERRN